MKKIQEQEPVRKSRKLPIALLGNMYRQEMSDDGKPGDPLHDGSSSEDDNKLHRFYKRASSSDISHGDVSLQHNTPTSSRHLNQHHHQRQLHEQQLALPSEKTPMSKSHAPHIRSRMPGNSRFTLLIEEGDKIRRHSCCVVSRYCYTYLPSFIFLSNKNDAFVYTISEKQNCLTFCDISISGSFIVGACYF